LLHSIHAEPEPGKRFVVKKIVVPKTWLKLPYLSIEAIMVELGLSTREWS